MTRKRIRQITNIRTSTDPNEFEQAGFARSSLGSRNSSRISIGSREIEWEQSEVPIWVANM